MRRVLLFGGTAEGRALCRTLIRWPVAVTVCVATDYGRKLLEGMPDRIAVHTGRLDLTQMESLMRSGFVCAIDATHPYAVDASRHIREAAARTDTPYLRLLRPESRTLGTVRVPSLEEAVRLLEGREGNILATTGAKELSAYQAIDGYASRVYVRVLPSVASLEKCLSLGFSARNILAMQGPFSRELNEALIRQLEIRWLVTKDGGEPGGFAEKIEAAKRCGIGAIVIGRPREEEGCLMDVLLEALQKLLEGTP